MRISVRAFRPWRMISWAAACGIRWVKPSSATVSPSRTVSLIASESDVIRAMRDCFPVAAPYLRPAKDRVKWRNNDKLGPQHNDRHALALADFHHSRRTRGHLEPGVHALWRAARDRHCRRQRARAETQRPHSSRRRRLAARA